MSGNLVTSTGHDLSDANWLDLHFNFSRDAYEAMVRWVGFQPSWHVLDAGCGSGSFLPLLAEQVGAGGRLSALDLAPENIAAVEARIRSKPLACPVETRVGSVLALPYPGATFDAVWNANVSQYLTDDELRQMLTELKRVTKPGGLVAVKEYVWENWCDAALDRAFSRLLDARCRAGDVQFRGFARGPRLPQFVLDAGLHDVRHAYFGVGKDGPLPGNDLEFRIQAWNFFAHCALEMPELSADLSLWQRLADPALAAPLLRNPDFHIHIEYIQVVGRVP